LQRDAVEEVAKNRFGDLELGEYKFEDFKGINEPKNIGMRTFINDMFKQIVDNGTLRKNANGKDKLSIFQFYMLFVHVMFKPCRN